MSKLFILIQYLLPQHRLSRMVGRLAQSRRASKPFIRWFAKRYKVDMSEAAEENLSSYATFNDFFTRDLKPGVRPLPESTTAVISPADGCISELGEISHNRILQAKGQSYSVEALLACSDEISKQFLDGHFATVYLSPRDYHRVHMPVAGTLQSMTYVPGKLFSVNQTTAAAVPNLFARNERLICIFDTSAGLMALVLVGAMIVAGIETVWSGRVVPAQADLKINKTTNDIVVTDFQKQLSSQTPITLAKGAEMGRFYLGSTAIVLFGPGAVHLNSSLIAGSPVKMGEQLGQLI